MQMLTSHHVELKSHTKANHGEMLNISKALRSVPEMMLLLFLQHRIVEAKTKAVGATATSRSLMLLFCFSFFHVGVGIQVRGFVGLSETV